MTSRDLSKKYKVGNFFSTFFVAHVLIFFHFSTRFPHSLFKNFSQKIFKRAQTMLQSWLKFTDSFSFHFSKLPRKNFLRKFLHPRLLRSSQWQRNFDNVLYFENNRRSLRSRKNQLLSLLRSSPKIRQNSLQTFCSYGTNHKKSLPKQTF